MSILNYIEKIKRENEGPRITAQEPRNMYSQGQLVTPSVDGSRPGYRGRKGTAEEAINRRTKLVDDYNKIVKYALNNRKIKNFSEPVEVTIKGKLTTINELPTVNEWANMNNVGRDILATRRGSLIPIKREQVYKKIVDDTIKLNNQTFTFSTPSDIAMDIGLTKNQGRGTGVEDLLRKGNVTKLLSKDEIVSNYIQHLIDNDAPLKDFTNNSIFKHVNSRNADLIKKTKTGSLSIPGSARTIDFNKVSKIMKDNHPELFAKIGRGGQIPFLSRSIQNKSDLGNLRLSEAFETTESGDIFFNEAKAKNINLKRALANITAETDILQGKLKLDQKSLAISNAQDKMVTDLNKYIREQPNVILDNPQFRKLAATRFEDGKFIIDKDPALIDDRLNRYIKRGFFSTDHKVSKRTGKLNIEFPTNKQIVPTFINGPIRSMENYIANNISKYNTNPLIKNNIDEIVNVAKTNNFTVNIPKGYSNIFGTNRTNVGAIQDIATVSADGKTLTSYDNQLKKFNFDIDKIPELSNIKNVDYTPVDKSKIAQTLETKLKTAETYIDLSSPEGRLKFRQIGTAKVLNKILENNKIKICNDKLSNGKGVVCGTKFAERDPNAFMEAIKRNKDAVKIINKPGLIKGALKGISAWAKKELGPMGWIGSIATIDSAFGVYALGQGKTPLQALDQTLWFLPKSVLKADEKMFKDVYERAGYTKEDFGEFQKWRELEDLDRQYFSAKRQTDFMQRQVLMPDDKTVLEKGLQKEVDALPDMYKDMGWNRPLFAITSEEEKTGEHPFYGPAVDRYNKIIDRSEKVYGSLKDPDKSWKDLDYTRKLVAMEQANRKKKLMRESLKYAPHLIPLFEPFAKTAPKEMRDQSFLYDEYVHPLYGPSVSPEQIAAVDEGRFRADLYSDGGRAGYMGGGIAAIRKPHAIPPEKQGLRSIMINGKKS